MTNVYLYHFASKTLYSDLAIKFKENTDINKIGAMVDSVGHEGILHNPRSKFENLKENPEIEYNSLSYHPDILHNILEDPKSDQDLTELESKYGEPWLWKYLISARWIYYNKFTYKEKLSIIHGLFNEYINIFDKFEPDIFICDDMGTLPSIILFKLVEKEYDGVSIRWHTTRVKDQYAVSESEFDEFSQISERFETYRRNNLQMNKYLEKATDYVEEFRNSNGDPTRVHNKSDPAYKTRFGSSIPRLAIEYFITYNFNRHKTDIKMVPTYEYIFKFLKDKMKRTLVYNSSIFEQPRNDEIYAYYPLHYQPEWSTLVLAPMYSNQYNQLNLVDQIRKSIPTHFKLYVKEHPTQKKLRPRDYRYYKKISDMDNVRLLPPDVNQNELIKNAELVTTITGTSGLEGAIYKKPVITFGKPSYHHLSNVYQCKDIDNMSKLVKNILYNFNHDEDTLLNYIAAVFEESFYYNREIKRNRNHSDYQECINNILDELEEYL